VRYQFVQGNNGQFAVRSLCKVMDVAPSGFYAWRRRPQSARVAADEALAKQIETVAQMSRGSYGSPRVYQELRAQGVSCGRNRVARLMRRHGITARRKRRFKKTTDSRHGLPIRPNVLARRFTAPAPNRYWASDITYIWTAEGWLYLAVVMDLYHRRIVGWSMQSTLEQPLVNQALAMALAARRPAPGLLHHSDRGSQYASSEYQRLLEDHGIECSMSRKGNCWDNAPTESLFSTLKMELVHNRRYQTRLEARSEIFEYIEVWYNPRRRHSALGYLSPDEFERRHRGETTPS
jgi:transposase InsO family protein